MEETISKEEELRYEQLQLQALDYARSGDTNELSKMIKSGMSVNLSTHKDDSLIMLATYNGHYETAKMLIELDGDINRINQRGQTPLEGVCFKGYFDIVKLLVQSGATINTKAITYASLFGNKDIALYLRDENMGTKSFSVFNIILDAISSVTSFIKNRNSLHKSNET